MICTSNKGKRSKFIKLLCLLGIAAVFLNGCGEPDVVLDHPYEGYYNSFDSYDSGESVDYYAKDLCVGPDADVGTEQASFSSYAEGAGVFNLSTKEITFSKNIYERLYPASTTKILTAYIIISNGNLDDMVTVSDHAVDQPHDSSTCGLKAGDYTSVRNLLYGLMLNSGNDAAIALAEYYSGSVEAFAEVMNQTAYDLGCRDSHFVNPNGLQNEDHYTTVYDMYLIFKEAIKLDQFVEIINTYEKTVQYSDITGASVDYTYSNTNKYINGQESTPDGIVVVGGKTGTTNAAGYCLVLLSKNDKDEPIVSIVFKAETRSSLYDLMNQMLSSFTH